MLLRRFQKNAGNEHTPFSDLADGEFDAAEIDKELISSRLKQDILSHSGKVYLFIADSISPLLSDLSTLPILRTRGHRFSVTSAVTLSSSEFLYTSGKEGSIIKWHLPTGKKLAILHKAPKSKKSKGTSSHSTTVSTPAETGHTDEVLALALSSDGKYLVSGGRDRRLIVWDANTLTFLKSFQGPMNHKDIISVRSISSPHLFTHWPFHRPFHSATQLTNSSPLPSTVPSNSTTSLLPSWVTPKLCLATKIQSFLFLHSAVKTV